MSRAAHGRPGEPQETKADASRGSYDIRKGAAGYASIMGSVAGFVVPTVILAFTITGAQRNHHKAELTLAIGLLVLSLLGCLVSAFALSALGGEEKLTINLPAAAMFMGVGIILSIVSILGAFEIFAHIFLAPATSLFAAMTIGGGVTGVIFNALSVVDDWELRHTENVIDDAKGWFTSRAHATKWTWRLAGIGLVPIAIGTLLVWQHTGIPLSTRLASRFAFLGLATTVATVIWGVIRSLHPDTGPDRGIRPDEAISIQAITGGYVLAVLLLLPH